MRRSVILVAAALAVAACTSDGGSSEGESADSTAVESGSQLDDARSESSDEASLDAPASSDAPLSAPPAPGEIVPLPGLLDTSDEPFPVDADVRTGTLPNGLAYYVRHNERPGATASLRLAIRAGSVNEIGDNGGVAHFVEHMLFNGTEQYPKNELLDVLRGFGASFGADVNAYTSFDETVYQLDVPNDDESFDAAMNILSEWLSHATFDPAEVDKERGIVVDEWRGSTQDVHGRLFDVAQGLYLAGSAYEGRDPIGTDTSIEGVTRDELVEYYDAWYRPDNAAVIVVGDIDVDDVVADIEERFGPATPRTPAAPDRPATSFAIETEPDFALHSDPDQGTVDVEVDLPLPGLEADGTAAARAALLDQMIFDVLLRRLDGDVIAGTAPFDSIQPGSNSFVSTLDAPALYATTDAEGVDASLTALLDEYERAFRFGFTQAEFEVARDQVQAGIDSFFDGRDTIQDFEFADSYVAHFLSGEAIPDAQTAYDMSSEILAGVTPSAMDLRFRARWTNSAPHVIISTPAADESSMPTRAEVLALVERTASRAVEPRDAGRELPDELMTAPAPAPETSRERLTEFGDQFFDPISVTYPNGVRVIATSNGIVAGQVMVGASSPGGSSLVADDDVIDALYAAEVVTASGVGEFNQVELGQILASSDVGLSAQIEPYIDRFDGSAATADLPTLFQLINQYMTNPRFDRTALDRIVADEGALVADPASDQDTAVFDALFDARYTNEPRYTDLPTPEQFATLDLAGVERVWRARFGDASDWVFVFAGDFDHAELFDLAARYLGTLPASGTPEAWRDLALPAPPGVVSSVIQAGTGSTASAQMVFTSPVLGVDGTLRANLDVANEVVATRLDRVIREELGDSYSPSAYSYVYSDPAPVVQTYVSLTGAPERIEAVVELTVAEFADLARSGPTKTEFDGALAQVLESYNFVDNGLYVRELTNEAIWPGRELEDWFDQYGEIALVTPDTVSEFIGTHIPSDRYVSVVGLPR